MRYSLTSANSKKRNQIFSSQLNRSNKNQQHKNYILKQQSNQLNNNKLCQTTDKLHYFKTMNLRGQKRQKSYHNYRQNRQQQLRDINDTQNNLTQQALNTFKKIMIFNEQKLYTLQKSLSNVQSSVMFMYKKHQNELKSIVSKRCQQFTSLLKNTLYLLKNGQSYAEQVEQKVKLCNNTMRNISQNLRLTKIKQDCIEAQIKTQNIQKINISMIQPENNHTQDQLFVSIVKNQDNKFDRLMTFAHNQLSTPKKLNVDSIKSVKSHILKQQEDFLLKKPYYLPKKNTNIDSRISHVKSYNNIDHYQYEPRYTQQNFSPFQMNQKLQNISNKNQHQQLLKYSDTYMVIKLKLMEINISQQKISCYLDQLGCLRRQNGTYILQKDGNVFSINKQQFKRLIAQDVIKKCQ